MLKESRRERLLVALVALGMRRTREVALLRERTVRPNETGDTEVNAVYLIFIPM